MNIGRKQIKIQKIKEIKEKYFWIGSELNKKEEK